MQNNFDVIMANNFDAIIILGYGQKNREISPMLKNRLDKAVEVFENNREAKIILSGGRVYLKEFSEAELMANYLENKAVKRENLILEDKSKDTLQNIKNSKKIIDKYQFKNVALITSDFHLRRVLMIAKSFGLNIFAISASDSKNKGIMIEEFFKTILEFLRTSFRI